MSAYRAFVFDLDGTLVDSRAAIEKAAQAAISEVVPECAGHPVTTEIGPPIRQMFRRALGEPGEAVLDRLVAVFRRAYDSGICRETTAYPGVAALLEGIHASGGVSFVLTNKPGNPTRQILEQLDFARYFREVVTPDSPAYPFSSKAIALDALLKRHAIPSSLALMVGDSDDDATAAERCGVAFAAAIYGYGGLGRHPAEKFNYTLQRVEDILAAP